jgi:p-aminobenzoyl-glutamate transporter AbgT
MNRLFARLFAHVVGAVHVVVLIALGALLVANFVDHPLAETARTEIAGMGGTLPPLVGLGAVFVAYVVVMGLLSTLIAINSNLERLAMRVDPSLSPHP